MILTFNRLCCVDFVFLTLNCVVFLTLGCFCVSHLLLILCFLPCVVLCWFCVSHLSKAPSHPGSRHGVQALPETVGNLKTLCLYDDHQIAYDDLFIVQCWFIIRSNVLLAIVPFGNIFKCRNSSHGWGITDKWQCFMMMNHHWWSWLSRWRWSILLLWPSWSWLNDYQQIGLRLFGWQRWEPENFKQFILYKRSSFMWHIGIL